MPLPVPDEPPVPLLSPDDEPVSESPDDEEEDVSLETAVVDSVVSCVLEEELVLVSSSFFFIRISLLVFGV